MLLTNFHTHSTFCDGKHSPEEIVKSAIEKGFYALGFSEHSYIDFDVPSGMTHEGEEEYKKEIKRLKEKYKNQLKIFLGCEMDYFTDNSTEDYEYVIGSVHYVKKDGIYITVDMSRDYLIDNVKKHYDGDIYAFCEDYYKSVADVVNKTDCQIIGHFDLCTKYNEAEALIDYTNPRYVRAVNEALEELIPTGRFFEINTGAISRGYRKTPYPAPFILKKLCEAGAPVILSSDSHHKDTIDCEFDLAKKAASEAGYNIQKIEEDTLHFIEQMSN